MNFRKKINHIQSLSNFSNGAKLEKKLAQFVQDAIHSHPGHLQPNTLIFTLTAPVE